MTKIVWDNVGERTYQAGVDRGVLYLSNGKGVPWNGLTSVQENINDASQTPYYFDGVKYYVSRSVGEYSATLKAYTYPDEFMEFQGFQSPTIGLYVDEQPVTSRFGLSYRTRVGNDIDGIDHGYKIHILYNLTATPSARSYATLAKTADPSDFSWDISGIPEPITGFRPTMHVILDSRQINAQILSEIEDILYGDDINQATIPAYSDLVTMIFGVIDNGDGTWTASGRDDVIQYVDGTTYQISWPSVVQVDDNSYTIS